MAYRARYSLELRIRHHRFLGYAHRDRAEVVDVDCGCVVAGLHGRFPRRPENINGLLKAAEKLDGIEKGVSYRVGLGTGTLNGVGVGLWA